MKNTRAFRILKCTIMVAVCSGSERPRMCRCVSAVWHDFYLQICDGFAVERHCYCCNSRQLCPHQESTVAFIWKKHVFDSKPPRLSRVRMDFSVHQESAEIFSEWWKESQSIESKVYKDVGSGPLLSLAILCGRRRACQH